MPHSTEVDPETVVKKGQGDFAVATHNMPTSSFALIGKMEVKRLVILNLSGAHMGRNFPRAVASPNHSAFSSTDHSIYVRQRHGCAV